jgi:hypothetical protein
MPTEEATPLLRGNDALAMGKFKNENDWKNENKTQKLTKGG